MRPKNSKGQFAKESALVERLTVEGHPILGRIERWRREDNSIVRIEEFGSTVLEAKREE